jgi:hypothetical protein
MKNLSHVVNLVVLAALAWLIFTGNKEGGSGQTVISSDTTIVVNNYYDTTIREVVVRNITSPVQVYEVPEEKKDQRLCDSVRVYEPYTVNDSIDIYSKLFVQGRLLNYDLSYKWKLPTKTEVSTIITKEIINQQHGVFGGINFCLTENPRFLTEIPIGLQAGYLSRKGNMFSYSYNLNRTHQISLSRIITFRRNGRFPKHN